MFLLFSVFACQGLSRCVCNLKSDRTVPSAPFRGEKHSIGSLLLPLLHVAVAAAVAVASIMSGARHLAVVVDCCQLI